VIAHALDAEIIESGGRQRPMTPAPGLLNLILFQLFVKDLQGVPPVKVDRSVVDGETLHELDGLQVIHTPGHSAGQVAFLWPQEGGLLFVGDAAANTLGLRLSISYEDLQLGKKTLARLAKLPFSKACFGHGPTISSGAAGKFISRWCLEESCEAASQSLKRKPPGTRQGSAAPDRRIGSTNSFAEVIQNEHEEL
jgi:glyoxylase-like metal-dependent hydrolase (beta-lactamase superfamily II)